MTKMTMQTVAGRLHTVVPMGDPSRVGEARRHAAQLAARAGLDETATGRLAIVVNELGNNLLRHAKEGRLLLAQSEGEVEIISVDRGPGMAHMQRFMADGFSTGGTPGTGLGAIHRLAQDVDMHSRAGEGTVIVARVRNDDAARSPHAVRIGGIATAAPGEAVCGDAWTALLDPASASIVVADGLGHGKAAAEASHAMVEAFQEFISESPSDLLDRAHARLRHTRGAAVCLVKVDRDAKTVTCIGAGNVMGRVISGVSDKALLTQHGTVGVQMRRSQEAVSEWPAHAIVVVHTDGIESRWPSQLVVGALARDPVTIAALVWRDHCRGRDDATVVVAMRREAA